jgi:hypothetical protein
MLQRALDAALVRATAALWLGAVASGIALLAAYASRPGVAARAPAGWPAASAIARQHGVPTVLVFAHPECPCTRATLGELDRTLARVDGGVDVHVLFATPLGTADAWRDADLARMAAAIPGVRIHGDAGGREAARFGVATSGQVLLYDARDRLRFAGGVTGARGHAGDNAGHDRLLDRLTAARGDAAAAPVFGCALGSMPAT